MGKRISVCLASFAVIFLGVFFRGNAIEVYLTPVANSELPQGLAKGVASYEGAVFENIYHRPLHDLTDLDIEPLPVRINLYNSSKTTQKVLIQLWAENAYGKKVDWDYQTTVEVPANSKAVEILIPFRSGTGTFKIHADVVYLNGLGKISAVKKDAATLSVCNLPPPKKGNFKYGLIMANCDWNFNFAWYKSVGYHLIRIGSNQSNEISNILTNNMQPYPIYDCDPQTSKSRTSIDAWIIARVNDLDKLKDYPLHEFINEPWIFGWRWQSVASEYRYCQGTFAKKAKEKNLNIRLGAASSIMLFTDVCEGWKESWENIDGVTDHPYNPSHLLAFTRPGDMHSNFDACRIVCRRTGLPRYYITEGGPSGEATGKNSMETAFRLIHIHAMEVMCGAFTSCNQRGGWGTDIGADLPNTALAVYSNMVTDRPPVADIWPYNELLWGFIFANKRHITDEVKSLPMANEINARWEVEPDPTNANDNQKVALIWSNTGESNLNIDNAGKLIISDVEDLKAYTFMGAEIKPQGTTLTIPFNQHPVYILTSKLSVIELRNKIRSAKIEGLTPVNMYALSLSKPANEKQDIIVRVENQMPFTVSCKLTVEVDGKSGKAIEFCIPEGRLREVKAEWPGTNINANNVYIVKMTCETKKTSDNTPLKTVSRQHCINTAVIANKKGINIDGNLGDWSGVTPVFLGSEQAKSWSAATPSTGTGAVSAKVYVAYDDSYVYVAADVTEPSYGNTAGQSATQGGGLPGGMPGGIFTIHRFGDAFSFAFGFRNRVPQAKGRDVNEPWCWKGHYYDTDYYYTAHASTQGDKLIQHWDESSMRRWGYQTDNLPEHKVVPNGLIKISRGSTTIYECAIPRKEIELFDPSKMDACRFAFIIINGERAGKIYFDQKDDMDYSLQYARAYGVFDHWNKFLSSWGPSWNCLVPCQTRFAIEGGVPATDPQFILPEVTPTFSGDDLCAVAVSSSEQWTQPTLPSVAPVLKREGVLNRNIR